MLFVALIGLAISATPVLGTPPAEKKVPVTIEFKGIPNTTELLYRLDSDGLSHRVQRQYWTVTLFIDDSTTPILGTAVSERQVLWAYSKLRMAVNNDYYEISFPTEEGGFEGNAHLLLTNYVAGNYDIQIHALFHGTGDFEGQTLNVGRDKGPAGWVWEGYLLKP